jgi:hypothetical protein
VADKALHVLGEHAPPLLLQHAPLLLLFLALRGPPRLLLLSSLSPAFRAFFILICFKNIGFKAKQAT